MEQRGSCGITGSCGVKYAVVMRTGPGPGLGPAAGGRVGEDLRLSKSDGCSRKKKWQAMAGCMHEPPNMHGRPWHKRQNTILEGRPGRSSWNEPNWKDPA